MPSDPRRDKAPSDRSPRQNDTDWGWALEFERAIHEFARVQSIAIDRFMKPLGITRAQGFMLTYLGWHPGATPSELADLVEVSRVASGALVKRLIELQFVEALSDPKDKRLLRLVLTSRGRKVVGQFQRAATKIYAVTMAGVTQEKAEEIVELLNTVKARLLLSSSHDFAVHPNEI